MKKNKLLWLIFVCVLFFFGCTREYACNDPYIDMNGKCCLDLNQDNTCDAKAIEGIKPYHADSKTYVITHEEKVLSSDALNSKWKQEEAQDRYEFFVERGKRERNELQEKYELQKENQKKCCNCTS